MIRNDLKIVRNEKGNPQSDNAETESEDDKIFLGFESEGKAVALKDCEVIVKDLVGNERTENKIVNKYQNEETEQVDNQL